MISPENIKSGDKFKVVAKFGLWDLTAYQTRLETQLKANEGWKKKADGNLMTLEELKQAPFEKPTIKDGLSLPPLSSSEERIAELQPGAEITTVQIMYHTGKAASGNTNNKDKAFQNLLVSTLVNDETKYGFVWTTHADVDHVEQIVPVEPPDPVNPPDPPPDHEQEEQSLDNEVHVMAGQTTILNAQANEGSKTEQLNGKYGIVEVELVDEQGRPYLETELVHLMGEKAIFSIQIDGETGKGRRDGIPVGEYELALKLGTVYFESDKETLSSSELNRLSEIANQFSVSTLEFDSIRCLGYSDTNGSRTYNENLCLRRAMEVKDYLARIQTKISRDKILTAVGGVINGGLQQEARGTGRVDIYQNGIKKALDLNNTNQLNGCQGKLKQKTIFPTALYKIAGDSYPDGSMVINGYLEKPEGINLKNLSDDERNQLLSGSTYLSLGLNGKLMVRFQPPLVFLEDRSNFPTIIEEKTGEKKPLITYGNALIIEDVEQSEFPRQGEDPKLPVSPDKVRIKNALTNPIPGKSYEWIEIEDTAPHPQNKDSKDDPGLDIQSLFVDSGELSVFILLDASGSMSDNESRSYYGGEDSAKNGKPAEDAEARLYTKATNALRELIPYSSTLNNILLYTFRGEPSSGIEPQIAALKNDSFRFKIDGFKKDVLKDLPFTSGTPLKSAIENAAKAMESFPTKCKVLVVITDGLGQAKAGEGFEHITRENSSPIAIEFVAYKLYDVDDRGTGKTTNTDKLKNDLEALKAPSSSWILSTYNATDYVSLKNTLKAIKDKYKIE